MATPKTTAKKAAPKRTKATADASLEAIVYSKTGTKAGTVNLPANIFGLSWNSDLVAHIAEGMRANARPTVAHTKDRSEVRGGGKKPWKQKGTGRARHGSSRSPIWTGGGVTFGPRSERVYAVRLPKKMRVKALYTLLSKKFRDGEVIFVEALSYDAPKTKEVFATLQSLAVAAEAPKLTARRKNRAFVAITEGNANLERSLRNIPGISVDALRNINPVDILSAPYLIIENPEMALKTLGSKTGKA